MIKKKLSGLEGQDIEESCCLAGLSLQVPDVEAEGLDLETESRTEASIWLAEEHAWQSGVFQSNSWCGS